MIFAEYPLPDAARGAASCAWRFTLEAHDPPTVQHRIPPDGTTNLILTRDPDGALFPARIGPSVAAVTVPVAQGWSYAGLRLRPEAARRVTGCPPVPGEVAPLPLDGPFALLWADLRSLAEDRPGSADFPGVAALFGGRRGDDPAIATAVDRLAASGGTEPLARLAAASGLSDRQFRRRFVAATGIGPKQYAGVQRVRRALILSLAAPGWAGIAADAGYADQPHFTRAVRDHFGATPGQIAGYFNGIRHELLFPDDVRFVQDRVRGDA